MLKEKKILFVQRVITGYRLELLQLLCNVFKEVGIVSSKGEPKGTLKIANYQKHTKENKNLKIHILPSIKIGYQGESRGTSLYLYPKALGLIKHYDIIVLEGTTNLLNNFYLIPYAKLLKRKIIWWDAGYSISHRSNKRKFIDAVIRPLLRFTDAQMAYSSLAKNYMQNYMGAKNTFLNLNTINTSFFETISNEIEENNINYSFDKKNIQLLYVGVVENRKNVKELINIVSQLNDKTIDKSFSLTVIGGGKQLEELKEYVNEKKSINLLGPIYDKNELKKYYFSHDLFVLPGDGGLAILQSLLYGLPVLSIIGADGTELDYITNKDFLVKNISEITLFLQNLTSIDRVQIIEKTPKLKADYWVTNFLVNLKKLYQQ